MTLLVYCLQAVRMEYEVDVDLFSFFWREYCKIYLTLNLGLNTSTEQDRPTDSGPSAQESLQYSGA